MTFPNQMVVHYLNIFVKQISFYEEKPEMA